MKKRNTAGGIENNPNLHNKSKRKKRSSINQANLYTDNLVDLLDRLTMDDHCESGCLRVKEIKTKFLPPHRYSTKILIIETCMLIFKKHLILYGGLGCQRGLTWGKLDYNTLMWEFPE